MKEKKEKCLNTAKRNLEGLRDLFEAGILLGASRPKNKEGEFCDSMMCELFQNHPVFKLEIWSQPWFVELAGKVRRAEEEETLESKADEKWSNNDVKAYMDQKFDRIEKKINSVFEGSGSVCGVGTPPVVRSPVAVALMTTTGENQSDAQVVPEVQANEDHAEEFDGQEQVHVGGDGIAGAKPTRKKRRPNGSGSSYQSRDILTVNDTWTEFRYGLNGLTGLEEMEGKSKGWRRENADTRFFIGRKPIYEEMKRRVDGLGDDENAVADKLEALHQTLRLKIASEKKKERKPQRHALQEFAEALKEFHLINGNVGPYTKPKIPDKKDKSICLGEYEFN
ncbi:MAG: hypothetical protein ACREOZ_01570 [Gloeomargaritales cyanobacterium]